MVGEHVLLCCIFLSILLIGKMSAIVPVTGELSGAFNLQIGEKCDETKRAR